MLRLYPGDSDQGDWGAALASVSFGRPQVMLRCCWDETRCNRPCSWQVGCPPSSPICSYPELLAATLKWALLNVPWTGRRTPDLLSGLSFSPCFSSFNIFTSPQKKPPPNQKTNPYMKQTLYKMPIWDLENQTLWIQHRRWGEGGTNTSMMIVF